MLISGKKLLERAEVGRYAVGHFNFTNMETLQAIISAAEEMHSPIIVATSEGAIRYMGLGTASLLARHLAVNVNVPIALHLDHGNSIDMAEACMKAKYTSIMYDGSSLPFEENVRNTRNVVIKAERYNVSTEAELGMLKIIDKRKAPDFLTDPERAKEFVEKTQVNSLAVAIGTAHGPLSHPQLDLKRLERINEYVKVPLVLHGASGVPNMLVKKTIALGIRKVNINTEIRQAFSSGIKTIFDGRPATYKLRDYLSPARSAVKKTVIQKIKAFGSDGKA